MFTFGREHERKSAVAYVRNPAQAALIVKVVDAVHDCLESKSEPTALAAAIRAAFVEGGSGVWEQAASWLRKCGSMGSELPKLWLEFAEHPTSDVRFRVACCLDDIPEPQLSEIVKTLLGDKSKKVAGVARARTGAREPGNHSGGSAA